MIFSGWYLFNLSKTKHDGLAKGNWTQNILDGYLAIDNYRLRLAVADFKTILTEISKLK